MAHIIAGSFPQGTVLFNDLSVASGFSREPLQGKIRSVEMVTEENKKKFIGAVGWGLVGMETFGLIGALAGILAGGNKKEVCFACTLYDGRKFIALADSALYQKFVAEAFNPSAPKFYLTDEQRKRRAEEKRKKDEEITKHDIERWERSPLAVKMLIICCVLGFFYLLYFIVTQKP